MPRIGTANRCLSGDTQGLSRRPMLKRKSRKPKKDDKTKYRKGYFKASLPRPDTKIRRPKKLTCLEIIEKQIQRGDKKLSTDNEPAHVMADTTKASMTQEAASDVDLEESSRKGVLKWELKSEARWLPTLQQTLECVQGQKRKK